MAENIAIEGIDECLKAFQGLERTLRKSANTEIRNVSKAIGRDVIIPMLGGSGSPQEDKIIAAAAPRSDRYIVVAIPQKKPRLSGVKKTPAAQAKRLGFALEGGSDYPPFHKPREGQMVHAHAGEMERRAVPRYLNAIEAIARRYGLL